MDTLGDGRGGTSFNPDTVLTQLQALRAVLPDDPVDPNTVTAKRRKALRESIEKTIVALNRLSASLDPVLMPQHFLDPSSPKVVGQLIAETLLVQERHALSSLPKFYGSGVYALYYNGPFDAYQPLAGTDTPIYVGKADPVSHQATNPVEQGQRLYGRLNDHKRSIRAANNLNVEDFDCRYLVVKSAWQGTAEVYLISHFEPVWNDETNICYGFGKHGDAPETRSNTRSPWDTLHPGRPWATRAGNKPYHLTPDAIEARILDHLRTHVVFV